jgi:DNA-binding response OmpR family regulator
MSHPACILVYGRDPSLLETRCMVLETTGSVVRATAEPEEAERIIRDERPALLVLCYTLSPEDRSSILSSAQLLRPDMKTLVESVQSCGVG